MKNSMVQKLLIFQVVFTFIVLTCFLYSVSAEVNDTWYMDHCYFSGSEESEISFAPQLIVFLLWMVLAILIMVSPDFYVILTSMILMIALALYSYDNFECFQFTLWLVISLGFSFVGIPRIIEYR